MSGISLKNKWMLEAMGLALAEDCITWDFVGADTPSEAVDTPDGDTSYIHSDTFGDIQLFTKDPLSECPLGPTVIQEVIQEIVARKDNSDPRSIVPVLKIGGNIYIGATFTLTTSYQTFDYVWSVNPATGLAWTLAEVNSLEFGVEVT